MYLIIFALLMSFNNIIHTASASTWTLNSNENFSPLNWAVCRILGGRAKQEDTFAVTTQLSGNQSLNIFGVYDGHNGSYVSEYVAQNISVSLEEALLSNPDASKPQILTETYEQLNIKLNADKAVMTGSTAVTAVVDTATSKATIAWAGDARAIILNGEEIIVETHDHSPSCAINKEEWDRVNDRQAYPQGIIFGDRLGGRVNVSRSFGDLGLKAHGMIPTPELLEHTLRPDDILLLCSDGLINVPIYCCSPSGTLLKDWKKIVRRPNKDCTKCVEAFVDCDIYSNNKRLQLMAQELCMMNFEAQAAYRNLNTGILMYDNATVILIQLARAEQSHIETQSQVITGMVAKVEIKKTNLTLNSKTAVAPAFAQQEVVTTNTLAAEDANRNEPRALTMYELMAAELVE